MAAIPFHHDQAAAHALARGVLGTARAAGFVAVCVWAATRGVEEGIGIWVRRATRSITG
jgi:hypothetical protein